MIQTLSTMIQVLAHADNDYARRQVAVIEQYKSLMEKANAAKKGIVG